MNYIFVLDNNKLGPDDEELTEDEADPDILHSKSRFRNKTMVFSSVIVELRTRC